MKQVYKITYPTEKIYIGRDTFGSFRYFGSVGIEIVNNDFLKLPKEVQLDYMPTVLSSISDLVFFEDVLGKG